MTYSAVIEYLYGLQKHGIKLGLETMSALLERIGHPHHRFPVLHIGGTNGKGSTAAMAASVLQHMGMRVGLYTSPHLIDFRERIRVSGDMISERHVADLVDRIRGVLPGTLNPTFFEMTTALAFLHFAQSDIDIAVLEVGLGGRFDATNVVDQPLACAITTIGFDHQEYLGHTEAAIAFEKAGIIKPHVPVVMGRVGVEAQAVIQRIAQERSAPLWQLGRDFSLEESEAGQGVYRGVRRVFSGLTCGLAGQHQWDNTACALALLEAAGGAVGAVDERSVREGVRSVSWEGRLEYIEERPTVVLDGAHNPQAAHVLARYLAETIARRPNTRVILVWGMMRDKDHRRFIAPLLPVVSEIVVTQATLARSATVQELRAVLQEQSQMRQVQDAVMPAEALLLAKQRASSEDLICVTGSLMLVGDIKAAVRGCGLSPIRG